METRCPPRSWPCQIEAFFIAESFCSRIHKFISHKHPDHYFSVCIEGGCREKPVFRSPPISSIPIQATPVSHIHHAKIDAYK